MKKILLALLAVIAIAILGILLWLQPEQPPAKQVFINGNVLTMDKHNRIVSAVAVSNDTITATGSDEEIKALIDGDTVVHDLQGKTLLPGFIDAHGHFPGSGLTAFGVDVNSPPIGKIQTMAQLLDAIAGRAKQVGSDQWVLAIGYDDTMLAEQRHPTIEELDAISTTQPIFVWHISGHMAVVNSRALALTGITEDSVDPDGGHYGRDSDGKLNGLVEENAVTPFQLLAMDFSALQFFEMIKDANKDYLAVGVTTAQSGAIEKQMAQGMAMASMLKLTPMRLELWPISDSYGKDILSGKEDPAELSKGKINIGAVKLFSDGSIQGYTGYLSSHYHTPYHGDKDYRGYLRSSYQSLEDDVVAYHKAGIQMAIHANGDGAIDEVIKAFAEAQNQHPVADPRLILIHSQMARDDQLLKMKQLGITPSFFSAHVYYWGDRHRDIFIGPERAARISPAKSAEAIELTYSLHLDTPVVPMQPLMAVWSSVNRITAKGEVLGPEQRVSVMTALRAVTIDAAWQIFQEDNRGSIEAGKLADLVILERDPLQYPMDIKNIRVEQTIIGGVEQL